MASVMVWKILANIDTPEPGTDGSIRVPPFLIEREPDQAPDRAGAERVARVVLNPAGLIPDDHIHVHIITVNMGSR